VVRFCIDADLLGTEQHLVCKGEDFTWKSAVPANTWHLSGQIKRDSDWCLDTLLRLGNVTVDLRPPQRFVTAMEPLLSGSNYQGPVPWRFAMPGKTHRDFVRALVSQVAVAMDSLPTNYYRGTWVPGNGILRSLLPARIDVPTWQGLMDARVGNVASVQSFRPGPGGFTDTVQYDRFGALTGRLTVTSGPMILTLKKEYRGIIQPSSQGGEIVIIDFAALEARVLLYEAGRRCDEPDLYGMIAKELGYDRKAVKGAVLCELYGSSKYTLGRLLGIKEKELNSFMRRVKQHFQTEKLLKRIKDEFIKSGRFTNRYGRQITVDEPLDHVFINYYAQSSGVDVALMGFSTLVEQMKTEAPSVRPLFVLHDGLFLDVPKEHLQYIDNVKSVKVKGYVQAFPLRTERVPPCTTEG
jgi:hypothetical protein